MEKTEPAEVIEAYKKSQKEKEEAHWKKMNKVVEARATRLRAIRDQMKEKDRHISRVQRMKDLNLDDMDPVDDVLPNPPNG